MTTACIVDVSYEADNEHSIYEYCMMICDYWLKECISFKRNCHGRKWPLPVPRKCMDKRYKCAEDCQLYKEYTFTQK
ncbi:hypothetical protein NP493_204g06077 [Ridgeia piscesae]|uniref:Uncharacterized protein n=1 Tax=Ridgeia piscesae TaxID=27915 RepID=A0AAD9P0R0_RIDPI|nr:hypothetical protein NP493_204g06077 [Ridgeia piscesae]